MSFLIKYMVFKRFAFPILRYPLWSLVKYANI